MSRFIMRRAHDARRIGAIAGACRHAIGAGLLLSLLAACGGSGTGDPSGSSTESASSGASGGTGSGSSAGTGGLAGTGGSGSSDTGGSGSSTVAGNGDDSGSYAGQGGGPLAPPPAGTPHADAFRLLTQASFGPTDADVAKVMSQGAGGWIDAQLALPATSAYVARWDADMKAPGANPHDGAPPIASQFYLQALASQDQLRERVAFALSQIFVVSTQELPSAKARSAASYFDMLNHDALGNYRTLLQDVAMHPAMGQYLSSLANAKENPATGQIPDQNFAREVMQLMSIGLSQLNLDGTKKLGANGTPIDTYSADDIVGLSKVFTGFSWEGADTSNNRFYGKAQDASRMILPMQAYPQFHSTSAKAFLGTTVPAQGTAQPATSLKIALDTLFNQPNVGPFIGRQLIQRLVTSNPSPAYVARVAAVFNNNGSGVRGDLKAVVRAILLDAEARDSAMAAGSAYGKVREPVLRLTAWMRAFGAKSDSGKVLVTNTDDPGTQLGQTPLRSASVFNFYRPGYVAPGSETGARNLTMPELQITDETSVAGYVNYMAAAVAKGAGLRGVKNSGTRPDVQADYTGELAVAGTSSALVDRVTLKLLGDGTPAAMKSQIASAVDSIAVPALKANKANQAQVTAALQNRVWSAVLLTLAAPEFIVQK
jgi:uncharacterized protein (DUF1800 family)